VVNGLECSDMIRARPLRSLVTMPPGNVRDVYVDGRQ
jgi:hypothetical protein